MDGAPVQQRAMIAHIIAACCTDCGDVRGAPA
jgi:hypothetical protein